MFVKGDEGMHDDAVVVTYSRRRQAGHGRRERITIINCRVKFCVRRISRRSASATSRRSQSSDDDDNSCHGNAPAALTMPPTPPPTRPSTLTHAPTDQRSRGRQDRDVHGHVLRVGQSFLRISASPPPADA
ncbi:hypothetical protein LSH36_229g04050 [Paralvinella palmiformis]|uniref:Uncharacterized protein n=1 Tax=Paralvinella palmiformis TaxID=53620 RepID=A0AAD9JMS9_9ANNE|nr:hypothetical protein LSH36_229g04050 [Paralvinella palmiformis]